jgi:hypothetical protein
MADVELVVHLAGPVQDGGQRCARCGSDLHPEEVGRWNEGFRVVEYQAADPREQRRLQLLPDEPIPDGAMTCNGHGSTHLDALEQEGQQA